MNSLKHTLIFLSFIFVLSKCKEESGCELKYPKEKLNELNTEYLIIEESSKYDSLIKSNNNLVYQKKYLPGGLDISLTEKINTDIDSFSIFKHNDTLFIRHIYFSLGCNDFVSFYEIRNDTCFVKFITVQKVDLECDEADSVKVVFLNESCANFLVQEVKMNFSMVKCKTLTVLTKNNSTTIQITSL